MSTLSAPNRVVWEYFSTVRRLANDAVHASSPELCREKTALTVIMAVTVTEVFFNLWFRVLVEGQSSVTKRKELIDDLSFPRPAPLDRKIRQWPKRYLGNSLNLSSGPAHEFMKLKELRNSIIHFTSDHETFEHENVVIHGLADTSDYDGLDSNQATWALQTAEGVVEEIFTIAGVDAGMIPNKMHAWTGKPPI